MLFFCIFLITLEGIIHQKMKFLTVMSSQKLMEHKIKYLECFRPLNESQWGLKTHWNSMTFRILYVCTLVHLKITKDRDFFRKKHILPAVLMRAVWAYVIGNSSRVIFGEAHIKPIILLVLIPLRSLKRELFHAWKKKNWAFITKALHRHFSNFLSITQNFL